MRPYSSSKGSNMHRNKELAGGKGPTTSFRPLRAHFVPWRSLRDLTPEEFDDLSQMFADTVLTHFGISGSGAGYSLYDALEDEYDRARRQRGRTAATGPASSTDPAA